MKNGLILSDTLPANPAEVHKAWPSRAGNAATKGRSAQMDAKVGGGCSAFGRILELTPNQSIVQAWQTAEFPQSAHDSQVEVLLEGVPEGTQVTLLQQQIPED